MSEKLHNGLEPINTNLTTNSFGNRIHIRKTEPMKTPRFGGTLESLAKSNPMNTIKDYEPGCCVEERGRIPMKSDEELEELR